MASILARLCLLPKGHRELAIRNYVVCVPPSNGMSVQSASPADAIYKLNWAQNITNVADEQGGFDLSYSYWRKLYDHYATMRSASDRTKKGVAFRHPLPELPAQIPIDFAWW